MLIKEAFREACTLYPQAIPALVWFATNAGLTETQIQAEDFNWLHEFLDKPDVARTDIPRS